MPADKPIISRRLGAANIASGHMILRMYELSAADMERLAGWPADAGHFAGGIRAPWPEDRIAIELAVASADARGKALSDQEQRATVRRLIPWLVRRLLTPEDAAGNVLVLRLDGRLQTGGLVEVLHRMDPIHTSLFHFTGASRLSPAEPLPAASLSLTASADVLAEIMQDAVLPLAGAVRLRVFAVPPELTATLLRCEHLDADCWTTILPQVSLFIGPSASLQSVFLVGPPNAQELRARLINGSAGHTPHPAP
jgi:hypothetical protein